MLDRMLILRIRDSSSELLGALNLISSLMAVPFSKSSALDRFYKRSLGCNTKTLSLRDLFSIGELHKYISKKPNSTFTDMHPFNGFESSGSN